MLNFTRPLPLSLYIHLPWCVRKCPYCDFNSHKLEGNLPESLYVAALLQELDSHLAVIDNRPLVSIFFGGGTPSLFSAQAINTILAGVAKRFKLDPNIEITLEANPGTVDEAHFAGFFQAGINRLSLGIQSLQEDKLRALGRIHDQHQAIRAIERVKKAGFENFNIDVMYGLPNQTIEDALYDIETALSFQPTHFSWYQLTIEPNTFFYHYTPTLPADDALWEMQLAGQEKIKQAGLTQYEVSAYARAQFDCRHNRNYWEFGDYVGVGAGAHSKMTNINEGSVMRFAQVKHPNDYLNVTKRHLFSSDAPTFKLLSENDLIFEFMLNALRLSQGVPNYLFQERTGLPFEKIEAPLMIAKLRGLIEDDRSHIVASSLGKQFLNDLTSLFLL